MLIQQVKILIHQLKALIQNLKQAKKGKPGINIHIFSYKIRSLFTLLHVKIKIHLLGKERYESA